MNVNVYMFNKSVCVCACMCAYACACVRACVHVCALCASSKDNT